MIDFTTIDYLKKGTPRQQRAYRILSGQRVFEKLAGFDPILSGTIPINIDIETSDLDIICCFADPLKFKEHIHSSFGQEKNFTEVVPKHPGAIAASFELDEFIIEVFGQPIPTREQAAYRHMVVEYTILKEKGEGFRQEIIALKKQGYKTEPAFGKLLGLEDNAYQQLLNVKP